MKLSKVYNVLGSLDVNKAVGPDGISPHMLKYCCIEFCLPLTILFTRIRRSGDFPLSWKVSRITPVYKQKGSASDPAPIAQLLYFLLWRWWVIHSQLYNHILPFIPSTQFGFIKGTDAQDCGTAIAFTATQVLKDQEECRIISLDIRGAFDSVWWSGLLSHLRSIVTRSKAYRLLCSYLSNESLFVVANGNMSTCQEFTAGVPQRGVWCPILFNLYIRLLGNQVLHCDLFQYC